MKRIAKIQAILLMVCCLSLQALAQSVNLTPWPRSLTAKAGEYVLPQSITIDVSGLSSDIVAQANDFADVLRAATGRTVTVGSNAGASITLAMNATTLADESYILLVNTDGITLKSSTVRGFFYGLQSIKKMLPGNVLVGKLDASANYAIPCVSINDAPRFAYRGFMLDVSRHFFTVEEVKKMLRLMSYYKMNYFHWHLTDDQGWRVEVKKYPKLISVASKRSNSWNTDLKYGQYWTNDQYGPYYYTQEEIRDVVDYAAKLHITVIPEIEMPGHLAAAMTAYPEFSCSPNGAHSVWVSGGISTDVLNVANDGAIQFAKDILTEIAPLFPSEVFHIGGDETPTTAWQNNAECRALYQKEGMTSYSQLQSRFTKIIAEHLKTLGKRIAVWNEAITAGGANTQLIKDSEAMIYCWTPCQQAASKAADLGLKAIITEYNSGGQSYYINRKPTTSDYGAGYGDNTLQSTYNYVPVPANVSSARQPYYHGVQGTFWCEHVSEPEHLEYLAIPKLMAVAEAGWTPQARKDWTSFRDRIRRDTTMLHHGGYNFHPQFLRYDGATPDGSSADMVRPKSSTGMAVADKFWYKIVSRGESRNNRQIELIQSGSALLTEMSTHGAAAGMIWSNVAAKEGASNYDAQLWAFELDPNGSGKYALVNKTAPDGSLNPTASVAGVDGKWSYDNTKKNYNFILGDNGYGTASDGIYYYSIRSDKHSGQWMNCAMPGRNYTVNLYSDPKSGSGGLWTFDPTFDIDVDPVEVDFPVLNGTYRITNTVERFATRSLCDTKDASTLTHTDDAYANDAWTVTSVTSEGNTAKIRLKNVGTGRFVGGPTGNAIDKIGNLVGTANTELTLTYQPEEDDFTISGNNMRYYPISTTAPSNAGAVAANSGAIRPQGTGWKFTPVRVLTLTCIDEGTNATMETFVCSRSDEELADPLHLPQFRGFTYQRQESVDAANVRLYYRRTSYNVDFVGRDRRGAIVVESLNQVDVSNNSYQPTVPEVPFYTTQTTSLKFDEKRDTVYNIVYDSEAYAGVKRIGKAVSELEDGRSYVFFDTSPKDTERIGYRNINPDNGQIMQSTVIENTDPYYVWTLERVGTSDNRFRVKNELTGKYIPKLEQSKAIFVDDAGDTFTFTPHAGDVWEVKGTNGQYWDGMAGSFTGWHTYGHPYKAFEYYVKPYFLVTVEYVYENGGKAAETMTALVEAGDSYTLEIPSVSGFSVKTIENADAVNPVASNAVVRVIYSDGTLGIEDSAIDNLQSKATAIYDLQGRRVHRIVAKGIYVINGVKVAIR